MSSFLWLLLYLAPLLGLTAAAFAWLGWRWRTTDLQRKVGGLQAHIDEMQATRTAGEAEHDHLREKARAAEEQTAALAGELKNAQAEVLRHLDENARAQSLGQSLKSELAQAMQELENTRGERDENAAALAAAHAEIERLRSLPAPALPPSPPKAPAAAGGGGTKRTRATPGTATTKPKAGAARHASLRDTLAGVESELSTHQSAVATLTQERDDWQQRVTKLEEQPVADPAGLGVAYRRLADSEARLQAASGGIQRLQNQACALRKVADDAAALAGVPDDDLTRIKGIKNVISEQLRAHGIRTWRQIAAWDDDELRAFSELLAFKNRATREKWKEQARALHEAAHSQLL